MSLLPLTITLRTITPHAIYLRLTSHFRFFATHLTLLVMSINQSINENFLSTPQHPHSDVLRPRLSGKEPYSESGGIENRHRLGVALHLRESRSRLLDQPQKKNGSALPQSGQMGSPNRHGQRITVCDVMVMYCINCYSRLGSLTIPFNFQDFSL